MLSEIREENTNLLNDASFTQKYFPQLLQMENELQAVSKLAETAQKSFEEIRAWAKEGCDICAQYCIKLENTQVIDVTFNEL